MTFSWNWLSEVVDAAVNLVDKAVPVAVGSRTKIAVVACPILGTAAPVVGALYPPAAPVLGIVQHVLCVAAPVTAVAGLLRKK